MTFILAFASELLGLCPSATIHLRFSPLHLDEVFWLFSVCIFLLAPLSKLEKGRGDKEYLDVLVHIGPSWLLLGAEMTFNCQVVWVGSVEA